MKAELKVTLIEKPGNADGLAGLAAPKIFEKAGPGCVSGVCPEGKRSCGMRWKGEAHG